MVFHFPLWAFYNGNRTEQSLIRSVIIRVVIKIGPPLSGNPICLIISMITDRIGRHKVLYAINHNHYNFRENKFIPFFCKRTFYTKFLAESLSGVTNSSILENPQVGRVSGCWYGYSDKLCDWWIKLSVLNMTG